MSDFRAIPSKSSRENRTYQPESTHRNLHFGVLLDTIDPVRREFARNLATQLGWPMLDVAAMQGIGDAVVLEVADARLHLVGYGAHASGPVLVDFLDQRSREVAAGHHSRQNVLFRAIDPRSTRPNVLDATAGFGTDAFAMAAHGCQVTAIERSPVMAALLHDGLQRGARDGGPEVEEVILRIELVQEDARRYLANLPNDVRPEVAYVDPMYAQRKRKVEVRKSQRLARLLVGDDDDAMELLALARAKATARVVVKRHRLAPPIADDVTRSYESKLVRFDVYESKQ